MLKKISEYVTYTLLKLEHVTHPANAIDSFVYDTIKIFLLPSIIIFVVSAIRSFFPPRKTKRILSHKKELIGNILAALLGIVIPFCSCSAVPLFADWQTQERLRAVIAAKIKVTLVAVGYLFNTIV